MSFQDHSAYMQGRSDGEQEAKRRINGSDEALGQLIIGALLTAWFCILFPLPTAAAASAGAGLFFVLRPFGIELAGFNRVIIQYAIPIVASLGTLLLMLRLESRLARVPAYYWCRHGVRLILLAAAVFLAHYHVQFGPGLPRNGADALRSASTVVPLGLMAVAVAIAHFSLLRKRAHAPAGRV